MLPPRVLYRDVCRPELFMRLSPDADDVWLYFMLLLSGVPVRFSGKPAALMSWRGSQRVSLFRTNIRRNDIQLRNLIAHYGFPLSGAHMAVEA